MLWLPVPVVSGLAPIAVSDASAAALERALLETDAQDSAVQLRSAMLVDPWFCQWMAAWPSADRSSVNRLALWFAERLVERLVPLDAAPPAWSVPDAKQQERFAIQAMALLAQAHRRVGVGMEPGDSESFLSTVLQGSETATAGDVAGEYLVPHRGVEWRLPRLVARLANSPLSAEDLNVRLEQAKLDAMKELAYGASHEVNNPLANISGRAQTLLRDETEPRKRRLLAAIDLQAVRAHEMISDLMLFARPPALEKESTEMGPLVLAVLDELQPLAEERRIALELLPTPSKLVATIDPTQIAVAVKALVQNGIDAVGNDGRVSVDLSYHDAHLALRISDTGPGIADDVRLHMFEPFYSGREAGRGLGFGLSKCWRIATDHGGSVEVQQTSIAGTTIVMRVPLQSEGH